MENKNLRYIEGEISVLDKNEYKIGIVASRFNSFITQKLIDGCLDGLTRLGLTDSKTDIFYVPGAFEIPSIVKKLSDSKLYDGIITLGCVIRGSTPHFDYVASEVSKGIANISISGNIPVVFGILTCDNIEQAIERAGTKMGNKGYDAAISIIEMINLTRKIDALK